MHAENGKKQIGIALSGGGARGITHIGILDVLEKEGLAPDVISGASFGAIVGAFYAAGYSPEELLDFVKRTRFSNFIGSLMSKNGLLNLDYLRNLLRKFIPKDDFDALKKPLYVSVTNLNTGKNEIVSKGKLFDYVVASASLPVIFKPVPIGESLYVDGGLLNNMPTDPLRNKVNILIGAHVNFHDRKDNIQGVRDTADRVFRLAIWQNVVPRVRDCDIFIEPKEMKNFSTFAFERADEFFKIGQQSTLEVLPQIKLLREDLVIRKKAMPRTISLVRRLFG